MMAHIARQLIVGIFFTSLTFCIGTPFAHAQFGGGGLGGGLGGGGFGSAVGGVKIDPSGAIADSRVMIDSKLRQQVMAEFNQLFQQQGDLNQAAQLRVISLKQLEAMLNKIAADGQPIPQEVAYMAGLQRIEFVILSPENNDLLIAGPAEPWTINQRGDVVGVNSGTPVIHLEDFLAAMRSSEASRTGNGISISIDPTEEGVRNFQKLLNSIKSQNTPLQPGHKDALQQAMGNHTISLTGVPADSRFAQVLVAADYLMKRLSMGFEPAPITDMPSVLEMASQRRNGISNAAPRFWMECNYEPIAKSEDGSIWQIRGQGVKTLTEESFFDSQGQRTQTGKAHPLASKWAETMTARFDELAAAEPVFRELRNAMDMTVIAALIARESLLEKVNLELPVIGGSSAVANLPRWNVPRHVPTQCNFVRMLGSAQAGWLISASGGVQLDPWGVAEQTEVVPELNQLAANLPVNQDRWWWNAR